jgi:hypothetical protein
VAVEQGQFRNRGRRTSAVGSRYPRTSEGQKIERTHFVCIMDCRQAVRKITIALYRL